MECKHTRETTEIKYVNKAKKFPQILAAIVGELSTDMQEEGPFIFLYVFINDLIKIKLHILLATFGSGFTVGTALAWTSPALPHIADCQEDCDFQFDDITGKHGKGVD